MNTDTSATGSSTAPATDAPAPAPAPASAPAQPAAAVLLATMPLFLRLTAAAAGTIFTGSPLVQQVLLAAASLLELGEAGAAQFTALTNQLHGMVSANRDPTAAEWETLQAHSDAAHAALQATGDPAA